MDLSKFKNLKGMEYSDFGAIALMVIGGLTLVCGIIALVFWIKYSWIRNTNSQNLNGAMVTKKILSNSSLANAEIKKSIMYAKYWNHNKKKNTYRLRPWTHDRQSLWTIMEATSQAYASTVRTTKSKEFWWLFRLPSIIKIIAAIVGFITAYLMLNADTPTGLFVTAVIGIIGVPFLFANCGGLYVLMKNAMPLVESLGLTEEEVKIIKRIYVLRFVLTFIATILDLLRLAIQLSESKSSRR